MTPKGTTRFKLIGNELVGQPEMEKPDESLSVAYAESESYGKDSYRYLLGQYEKHITSLPRYTVLPSDLEHFRSKDEWKEGEFVVERDICSADVNDGVKEIARPNPSIGEKREEAEDELNDMAKQLITLKAEKLDMEQEIDRLKDALKSRNILQEEDQKEIERLKELLKNEVVQTGGSWENYKKIHNL